MGVNNVQHYILDVNKNYNKKPFHPYSILPANAMYKELSAGIVCFDLWYSLLHVMYIL